MTERSPNEHRAVPLYLLREFYMDMVELTSLRSVASAAGITRSTLHKFVADGSVPHPRTRRLLALYYLQTIRNAKCDTGCRLVTVIATFWHLSRSVTAARQINRRHVPRNTTPHLQDAKL